MWWQYFLVFVCAMGVDIIPFPLPPAFTVMIFLQLEYNLNIWWVIVIGVIGSILGRYILTLYIPFLAGRLFNPEKNAEVQLLGEKLKNNGWKSATLIFIYSLMPLPTTPLFVAGGMAKIKPAQIIPPFFAGKLISDAIAVILGKYATENTQKLVQGMVSWQTFTGLIVGFLLVAAFLFIDWNSLLLYKKMGLKFKIWK